MFHERVTADELLVVHLDNISQSIENCDGNISSTQAKMYVCNT